MKTKKLVKESLKELSVKAKVEEVLIDTDGSARQHKFLGSPTIRINGEDIQKESSKGRCMPCEDLVDQTKGATEFVKQECKCGCRTYFYKDKLYPYPPKEMIKDAIKRAL